MDMLWLIRTMGGGDNSRRLKVVGAIYPPVSDRVTGASRTLKNACEEFDMQQVDDLLPLLVGIPICIEHDTTRVVGVVTASTKTHGGGIDIEFEIGGESSDCEKAMHSLEEGTLSGLSLAHRYEKEPGCDVVITPLEVSLCDTPKRKTFTRCFTKLIGHHQCSAGEEGMQHIYQVGGEVRIVGQCEMSLPSAQEDRVPTTGDPPNEGPPKEGAPQEHKQEASQEQKQEAPQEHKQETPQESKEEAPPEPKEEAPPEPKEEAPPEQKEEAPPEQKEEAPPEQKGEGKAENAENEAVALLDRAADRISLLQLQLEAEKQKSSETQEKNRTSMARLSSLLSTDDPEQAPPEVIVVADVHKASASPFDLVAARLRQQESTIKQQRATINYTAGFGDRELPDTHMQGECAASAKRPLVASDFAGIYRNEVECKGFVSRRRLKQMYEDHSADTCSGIVQASSKRARTTNGLLASRAEDKDEGVEEVSTAQVCPELMDKIMSYVTGATPTGDTLDRIIKSSQ
jgi:hypothetical protein